MSKLMINNNLKNHQHLPPNQVSVQVLPPHEKNATENAEHKEAIPLVCPKYIFILLHHCVNVTDLMVYLIGRNTIS